MNSCDENVFEWRKLLNSAFTDVKEKLDQKRIKLIRRIGTEYSKVNEMTIFFMLIEAKKKAKIYLIV